jgi:hypothetical protein
MWMNALITLLLKLFGDSVNLTDILAQIAAKLLEGLTDPSGCKEHLLQMIRTGTLDDKFKENPLGVAACMLHVLLAFADQAGVHVHETVGATSAGPVTGILADYAEALGVQQPVGGNAKGLLIDLLISQLGAKLAELLLEWLKNRNKPVVA